MRWAPFQYPGPRASHGGPRASRAVGCSGLPRDPFPLPLRVQSSGLPRSPDPAASSSSARAPSFFLRPPSRSPHTGFLPPPGPGEAVWPLWSLWVPRCPLGSHEAAPWRGQAGQRGWAPVHGRGPPVRRRASPFPALSLCLILPALAFSPGKRAHRYPSHRVSARIHEVRKTPEQRLARGRGPVTGGSLPVLDQWCFSGGSCWGGGSRFLWCPNAQHRTHYRGCVMG